MVLHVLRGLFLLILAGVVLGFAQQGDEAMKAYAWFAMLSVLSVGVIVLMIDIFIPQKSLVAISGMFFGLVAGLAIAYGLTQIAYLLVDIMKPSLRESTAVMSTIKICIGVCCCYLTVSFVLQTKDDIRFVIPYVEFSKQSKGAHPLLLDTSVIVDGRFADICETAIIDAPVLIPRFVLNELQTIADSGDRMKRNRGRRGLDVLHKMQASRRVDVQFVESRSHEDRPVDERLVLLAKKMDAHVVTNDYNLNKWRSFTA